MPLLSINLKLFLENGNSVGVSHSISETSHIFRLWAFTSVLEIIFSVKGFFSHDFLNSSFPNMYKFPILILLFFFFFSLLIIVFKSSENRHQCSGIWSFWKTYLLKEIVNSRVYLLSSSINTQEAISTIYYFLFNSISHY